LLDIYVDADGCPVKQEVYRVARRYGLKVILVANARMRIPDDDAVELVVVGNQFDAADDIPLADRCLKAGARVLGLRGRAFREDSIGSALANRELLAHLRETGTITGGPAPFRKRDRSQFLQRLDEIIQSVRRQ
jgi:uncharacterized protein